MVRVYGRRYKLKQISLMPRLYAVRTTYFVRDYLTDGLLPIILGLFAIAALYDLISVQWIQNTAPTRQVPDLTAIHD